MDIKWKKYSHSLITKIIVFVITILCFTSAITISLNVLGLHHGDFDNAFIDSYYLSKEYMRDSSNVLESLTNLIGRYKSEEYILKGGAVTEAEVEREKNILYSDFQNSKSYNPNLTNEENYQKFEEVYAEKISQINEKLINEDLREYNAFLRGLEEYQGLSYFASDGENVFTNSPGTAKDYFKAYPAYMIIDKSEVKVFPEEVKENSYYYLIRPNINGLEQQNKVIYLAFTEEFLNPRIEEWKENKEYITNSLYQIMGFSLGLLAAFIYLLLVIGRKPSEDNVVQLNFIDRIYNDLNLAMCFSLIAFWFGAMNFILFQNKIYQAIFPITLLIGTLGLILVLALVKHLKNRTFIKHTLIYTIFHKLFDFIKEIYDSGSVGVKIVLIMIGYPIIVALTFFMFPITIGVGVWIALTKVKEFKAIKEGVEKVKAGELQHQINVAGNGEFARLASDINSITDGLNKAVDSELKSERLKTELITNVSHDIRTPLTSIITYVDLLKNETDQKKSEEYLKIIDQKSQRLKTLTEDLFEASKASSGNIPVNYEKIDLASLLTQGLGELDDKIKEQKLEFKISYPKDKVYVKADGKLLWRVIENLLSNVFKYALKGSRVYIAFEDLGAEVRLVIKNISASELNISSEELMERFKRGDEARSSQGSGLGLSIAKSLIEIQKGIFKIEIDGDLFKSIIQIPKAARTYKTCVNG